MTSILLPRTEYLLTHHAALTPNTRFSGTEISTAITVSFRADKASGSKIAVKNAPIPSFRPWDTTINNGNNKNSAKISQPRPIKTRRDVALPRRAAFEEAAACLGAKPLQVFRHILVPALLPAWLTGFALAFARGVGEYGSVIFIAGNMPMKTEILPLLIMVKLDQYDYTGATSIGVLMLVVSFVLLLLINLLQRRIETP